MGDLFESFEGRSPDSLGRRVGIVELGMSGFEGFQFAEDPVVFGVRDDWSSVDVVEAIMTF
jgi:hypothetical protein